MPDAWGQKGLGIGSGEVNDLRTIFLGVLGIIRGSRFFFCAAVALTTLGVDGDVRCGWEVRIEKIQFKDVFCLSLCMSGKDGNLFSGKGFFPKSGDDSMFVDWIDGEEKGVALNIARNASASHGFQAPGKIDSHAALDQGETQAVWVAGGNWFHPKRQVFGEGNGDLTNGGRYRDRLIGAQFQFENPLMKAC